jgi:predicted 3-demethylubiquinone-9 3-methyltransferase (glyoxalase superfamily)
MPRIVPNLWFDGDAEEAAEFYVSLFPNSEITNVLRYTSAGPGPEGTVLTVDFELDGQRSRASTAGPSSPSTRPSPSSSSATARPRSTATGTP